MTSVAEHPGIRGSTRAPARPAARLLLACALLVLGACSRAPEPIVLGGPTMGTSWSVRLAAPPPDISVTELRAGIEAILETINAEMSTFREDADITRFNRAPAGTRMQIPEDFAFVLGEALALAEATGGAFDPTVGPLVNLWGFGPEGRRDTPPDPAAIVAARERVGWQRVRFDPDTRELVQPGDLYLDLSAIAKGHAVDRIAEHLLAHGVEGFVVDIGGDLRTQGLRPDGRPWRIAIERPLPGQREIHSIIEPGNQAMATSGSYRNHFRDGGQTFSHTIDPRTGYPITHRIVSLTVLHARCVMADALATALSVLDPDEGAEFARVHGLAVMWLLDTEEGVQEQVTPAFALYLQEHEA